MQQISGLTGTALLLVGMLSTTTAEAFFGNMMNPSRWFGGDRDYDDYYYEGPVGPGYGPGYYAPPMGYGAPGYAPPGYAAPVQRYAPAAYSAPATTSSASSDEIRQLKQRIEQLEREQAASSDITRPATYGSNPGKQPGATPAPQSVFNNPKGGQITPAAAGYSRAPPPGGGGSGGYTAPPVERAAPVQPAGQQRPPTATEWRPSGYIHPAMQQ